MADTSYQIPDNLPELDPAVTRKAATYATLRTDAAMRFQVQSVEKGVNGTGSLYLKLGLKPLNDSNKPVSPGTTMKLIMPWANPTAVGSKYETVGPNTLSQWHSFLNAINAKQFPHFPRGMGNMWVTDSGEELRSFADNQAYRETITQAVGAYARRCWNESDTLLKEVFIAQPRSTVGNDGKTYIDVDPYKCYSLDNPPTDVPVVSDKFSA